MEYQDKKPRRKREDRQEIGEQLLVGSIIGEIDRLEAIGKQAGRTAETYQQIFNDLKGYKLQVDTDALDTKEKEFAAANSFSLVHRHPNGAGSLMAIDRDAVPLFCGRLLLL